MARLPRVALIAAGATTVAIAACNNDDSLVTAFYGGACPPDACNVDLDAAADSSLPDGDVVHLEASADSSESPDGGATDGGPPLDAANDVADGD